eukprot:Hpha_TRINITY_DN16323_c2_g4::TRINITY_DN16323_c2_g4_i1::g.60787::m.60787
MQRICSSWICSGWIVREGEPAEDTRIKRMLTPWATFYLPVVAYLVWVGIDTGAWVLAAGTSLDFVTSLYFLVRGACGKPMGVTLDHVLPVFTVALLCVDLHSAGTLRNRVWSLIVIMLDLALVFERERVVPFLLGGMLFYLAVEHTERVARFGLYDVFVTVDPAPCNCASPPCGESFFTAAGTYAYIALVLLGDFHFTRGFARDLRTQLCRVNASVQVAGEVAAALARYDVEGAEEAIRAGESDLPPELVQPYMDLVQNLRSYRAYLPHSCLVPEEHTVPEEQRRGSSRGSAVGGLVEM